MKHLTMIGTVFAVLCCVVFFAYAQPVYLFRQEMAIRPIANPCAPTMAYPTGYSRYDNARVTKFQVLKDASQSDCIALILPENDNCTQPMKIYVGGHNAAILCDALAAASAPFDDAWKGISVTFDTNNNITFLMWGVPEVLSP